MTRSQFVLGALSIKENAVFTPVQVQKIFFLLDRKLPRKAGAPYFNFEPYHYGPFDSAVYNELNNLEQSGEVEFIYSDRLKKYSLTMHGQKEGRKIAKQFDEKIKKLIEEEIEFVVSLPFYKLVSAIYQRYPEMKVNSIFNS